MLWLKLLLNYLRFILTPRIKPTKDLLVVVLSILLTDVSLGNITGSDTQNFNPTSSAKDFVTVYSTKTLGAGQYSLGLFFNYAINTLPYFDRDENNSNDTSKSYNDAITGADVALGVGVFDNLDLGIVIPYVVHQHVTRKNAYHGQFKEPGNTEVRLTTKLRVWNKEKTGIALVGNANFNRIEDNPYTGEKPGPSFTGELVADHTFGDSFTVAANVGYRFRQSGDPVPDPDGDTPITPIDNQVIASGALSYKFLSTGTELIGEVYGSQPSEDISELSPREASVYETVGGIKQEIADDFYFHFGVGGEIQHSISSPDFRVYTGISYMPKEEKKVAKPKPKLTPKVVKRVVKKVVVIKDRQPDQKIVIHDVLFKFNSAEISNLGSLKSLEDLGKLVTGPKGLDKLVIEGHTCSIGQDAYNMDLSKRRADAIKSWLVTHYGVDPNKIVTFGYGESKPIASNSTASGRRLNRRVEFKVYHAQNQQGIAQK